MANHFISKATKSAHHGFEGQSEINTKVVSLVGRSFFMPHHHASSLPFPFPSNDELLLRQLTQLIGK